MPRNLESCERVCNLLLLLELLRRRQADSKPEAPESLLSLVGERRGRRPRQAEASFKLGLNTFKRRPKEPEDVMVAGLDLLVELGFSPGPGTTKEALEQAGLRPQQRSRPIPETLAQLASRLSQPALATHVPIEPIPLEDSNRRILPERTKELICAAAMPFLAKGAVALPHPILKAAAVVALYGCGLELAE